MSPQDENTLRCILSRILAEPADDTLRIIYADALEEAGAVERSEFIRVQVELPKCQCKWSGVLCGSATGEPYAQCSRCAVLRRRESKLLKHDHFVNSVEFYCILCLEGEAANFEALAIPVCVFRRGFISSVRCSWRAWREHGPAIVRRHPVERVEIVLSSGRVLDFHEGEFMPLGRADVLPYDMLCILPEPRSQDDLSAAYIAWAKASPSVQSFLTSDPRQVCHTTS